MARQQKEIDIDGHRFRLKQLGALEALGVTVRFAKLLGPVIAEWDLVIPKAKGKSLRDTLLDIQVDSIELKPLLASAGKLLEQLDERTVVDLARAFGKVTNARVEQPNGEVRWPQLVADDGSDVVLDEHFAGEIPLMLKWLAASLAFNGARFLGASPNTKLSSESSSGG